MTIRTTKGQFSHKNKVLTLIDSLHGSNWMHIAVGLSNLFSTSKDMILDACRDTGSKNRKAKCLDRITTELQVWPFCALN